MEDREKLISYNDVFISQEEIKKYENEKINDAVLLKIKTNMKRLYKRANMEEAFEKVEDQFEKDEKVKYVFWAETYGVRLAQGMGYGYASISSIWTSWPTKTAIILTDKSISVIEANDLYLALKIKHYNFKDIDYIENKNVNKGFDLLTIKPLLGQDIKLEMRHSEKHLKFIEVIKENKLDMRIKKIARNNKDKIAYGISIILAILIWILLLWMVIYRNLPGLETRFK
ncbi:hypothetical protein [Clostridium felsineum]|uniref:hypothetical protein n=1 Tax=Clostridium felsineum TaxID=36839 RepID=UPI00098C5F9D|nr:hypothetical protein [Clostridium felsineum]URZ03660.1 hypothetical protein CLAUR_037210 [Clostridium felsineum]